MSKQIKITCEFLGSFRSQVSNDYRVMKIQGAPMVQVVHKDGVQLEPARVGDIITEKQATELAARALVDLTVVPRQ